MDCLNVITEDQGGKKTRTATTAETLGRANNKNTHTLSSAARKSGPFDGDNPVAPREGKVRKRRFPKPGKAD